MTTNLRQQTSTKHVLISLTITFVLATSSRAQVTNAAAEMKPTVVTGSYIPTAETVGPAPVQTLTTETISQIGQADTLLTLKKAVPGFTGGNNVVGSVNNNFGIGVNTFTGESDVALRNLPTLVLLDGQRIANSALSAGLGVDINNMPLAMIDRVEVLKDGASAIYGSDAVGGVINIITKKNWNGFEVGGRYGFPTEGPGTQGVQYDAYVVAGITTENTTFTAGGQYYEQNALAASSRQISSLSIQQSLSLGVNPQTYISPSYPGRVQDGGGSWILADSPFAKGAVGYNPNLVTPPVFAGHSFTGSTAVSDYNTYAVAHGYTAPGFAAGTGPGPYINLANTPGGAALDAIGVAAYPLLNTTSFGTTSILDTERKNFWANFDHQLFGDHLSAYGSFLYADDFAEGTLAPAPVPFLSAYNIAVPANSPYNPFQTDLGANGAGTPRVRSRFVDFGNRTFDSYSDFYQVTAGLKGNINPDYRWDASYNYSRDSQQQITRNAVNGAALNTANQPLLDANGNVVYQNGKPLSQLVDANGNNVPLYDIFLGSLSATPGVNDPATIAAMKTSAFFTGLSDLWSARGVVNGTPLELPAGKLAFAVGVEHIQENLGFNVDGLTQLGLNPGLNQVAPMPTRGRERTAGFIEVNIPVLGKDQGIPGLYDLEVTAAGRYESISPGGDRAVPKVGIRWQPLDEEVTLRGSYSQGFVAPQLFYLYGPSSANFPNLLVQDQVIQGQVNQLTNPNLKPSDTEQWNAGIVVTPKFVKNLTVSADYYHVTQNNAILIDPQGAVNYINRTGLLPPLPGANYVQADGTKVTGPNQITPDSFGILTLPYTGSGNVETEGIDFALNYGIPLDQYGKLTLGAVANYIFHYYFQTAPTEPKRDFVGTYTSPSTFGGAQGLIPDFTVTPSLTYEYKGLTYYVSATYIPETQDPGFTFIGAPIQGQTINGKPYTISSYYTVDMQLSYEFGKGKVEGRKWYDGTKLTVGCNNIADAAPPLVPSSFEDNTDKNNYDILGRFVYFEVSKKF